MKLRFGFVSNSSSMSFVIKIGEDFPNVFALAKWMVEMRGFDDDKDILANINKSKRSPDTPISFETINAQTYIMRSGDFLLVDTSHNHNWWEDLPVEYPNWELYKDPKGRTFFAGLEWDPDCGFRFDFIKGKEWMLPAHDNRIVEGTEGFGRCEECMSYFWIIDGVEKCPSCDRTREEQNRLKYWRSRIRMTYERQTAQEIKEAESLWTKDSRQKTII